MILYKVNKNFQGWPVSKYDWAVDLTSLDDIIDYEREHSLFQKTAKKVVMSRLLGVIQTHRNQLASQLLHTFCTPQNQLLTVVDEICRIRSKPEPFDLGKILAAL